MELNEFECVREGDCECAGGGCASVAIAARYWMTFFVLSVLPAPDSPLRPCQYRDCVIVAMAERT